LGLLDVLARIFPKLILVGAAVSLAAPEGVAVGVAVGVPLCVAVGEGDALDVGVAEGVGVRLALAVGLALAVDVGVVDAVGVAVGVGPPGTISLVTKASLSPGGVVWNEPVVMGKSLE
jgi:hypothetical protein